MGVSVVGLYGTKLLKLRLKQMPRRSGDDGREL
jgi:hypothetical protein